MKSGFDDNIAGDVERLLRWLKSNNKSQFSEREGRIIIKDGDRFREVLEHLETRKIISERLLEKSEVARANNPKRYREVLVDLDTLRLSQTVKPVIEKLMKLENYETPRQAALGWGIPPATFYRWVDPDRKYKQPSEEQFEPILAVCDRWNIAREELLEEMTDSSH